LPLPEGGGGGGKCSLNMNEWAGNEQRMSVGGWRLGLGYKRGKKKRGICGGKKGVHHSR